MTAAGYVNYPRFHLKITDLLLTTLQPTAELPEEDYFDLDSALDLFYAETAARTGGQSNTLMAAGLDSLKRRSREHMQASETGDDSCIISIETWLMNVESELFPSSNYDPSQEGGYTRAWSAGGQESDDTVKMSSTRPEHLEAGINQGDRLRPPGGSGDWVDEGRIAYFSSSFSFP